MPPGGHLLFNVVGALIFLPVLPWFIQVVRLTSPSITRQIANAHTVFNVSNTLILLPLSGVLAYVVTQLVPEDPREKKLSLQLDSRLLATPEAALQQAYNEVMPWVIWWKCSP